MNAPSTGCRYGIRANKVMMMCMPKNPRMPLVDGVIDEQSILSDGRATPIFEDSFQVLWMVNGGWMVEGVIFRVSVRTIQYV